VTDEKLTYLAMISIESETVKICDMFESTKSKNICRFENLEKSFFLA